MSVATTPAEQRVVLEPVSWSTYLALLEDMEGRGSRMAYDHGVLEIMTPSLRHERCKGILRRLIETAAEELSLDILSAGSTTLKQESLRRGIEADECYYIANAAAVRGKDDVDLAVDPPPDLAVEVDITRSSLDKLGIYDTLGVAEVWRYDGEQLRIHVREQAGSYRAVDRSALLEHLTVEVLVRFIREGEARGETAAVRALRVWLRDQL